MTVNEMNEVRAWALTSTKGHDQCMPSISATTHSLRLYGHEDTEIAFTDSPRADKAELERAIPSLRKCVVPVPSSSMEQLVLPDDWKTHVFILRTTYQVNTRMDSLMEDDLQNNGTSNRVYQLDLEWSVDIANGIQGRVALISLVHNQFIYLIPVSRSAYAFLCALLFTLHIQTTTYMENGFLRLPHTLLVFLRSSQIQKIGVHVKADLTRLFGDCGFKLGQNDPFLGAVELGEMARQRGLTERANIGLADLTATVLHRSLPKEFSVRVSTNWDNANLTQEQIHYACLDVYAAWAIHQAFTDMPVGSLVTETTLMGTHVRLLSRTGNSTVAYGVIAPDRPPKFNGVNVTKTRTIVNITSIVQPAYLVRADLLASRQAAPLSSFGDAFPFSLLCQVKDLQTCAQSQQPPPSSDTPLPPEPYIPLPSAQSSTNGSTAADPEDLSLSDEELDFNPEVEQLLEGSRRDPDSELKALSLNSAVHAPLPEHPIRSRVLGDIFHVTNQFKISVHHGMRRPFMRSLRDALLIPDAEDKANVSRVLAAKPEPLTFAQKVKFNSDWVWQRVKRYAPAPEILTPRVTQVLQFYGPLLDAVTGQPLFNDSSWEKAKNVIENVRMGYYSDPPGVSLYTNRGADPNGLPLYRCLRGTNNVEGGIHQNIIKRFGSYNASPRFAVNLLRDYCLGHNLRVCKQ